MADTKISGLPASTTPLDGTEVLPIVQGSTTKQVSVANLTSGRAVSGLSLNITNTGKFGTTVGVGGATPAGTGSGITFPNTQSSSSDINTLDDYEEGTWTAVASAAVGTVTLSANTCVYTKIGRQVTVTGSLSVASVSTPSSDLQISGFPFTAAFATAVTLNLSGLNATATTAMMARLDASTTGFYIFHFAAGSSAGAAGDFKAGSSIQFSCTYFTTT